jgi:glucose dehydrogenase
VQKDGKDVIVHLNKGGFVFVMDKKDGKLENVWQFAENVNWVKGIDPKTGALIDPIYPEVDKVKTFCPNLLGARSWNHGAYNPGTGLWYSHAMEVCNEVVAGKDDPDNLKAVSALSLGIESIKLVCAAQQQAAWPSGCARSADRQAQVDHPLRHAAAVQRAHHGRWPGVHRRHGRQCVRL